MDANVINSGGNVAPGDSPGTITIAGNYMQSTGGELDILFSDTNAFDVLNVLGTATLGGTLKITVEDHRGRSPWKTRFIPTRGTNSSSCLPIPSMAISPATSCRCSMA